MLNSLSLIENVDAAEGDYTGTSWSTSAVSGNTNPRGITTDGTNIWIADETAAEVYKYNMDGDVITWWDTNAQGCNPVAITTDGNYIWVVDGDRTVYRYNMDGSGGGTTWNGPIAPKGILTDGNYIWITEWNNARAYKYSMIGGDQSSYFETESNLAMGGTSDGTNIWIIDGSGDEVYKYTMAGVYTGVHWDTAVAGATNPHGIATDGDYFWVLDNVGDIVYKYEARDLDVPTPSPLLGVQYQQRIHLQVFL